MESVPYVDLVHSENRRLQCQEEASHTYLEANYPNINEKSTAKNLACKLRQEFLSSYTFFLESSDKS